MKRVAVSGATGFIGRQSLKFLGERGFEVHGITTKEPPKGDDASITWHQVDLLDAAACARFFETVSPTHLLHFAWYAEPGKYQSSSLNLEWVRASLQMLRDFQRYGGDRATFAGTCFEYDLTYGFCSEERTPVKPNTFYGVCKNALREVAEEFSRQNELRFSWGRIFFLYGSHEHPNRLVSSVIISLLRNKVAKTSHGRQLRDYLYVDDVASALVALLDTDVAGVVNIASGQPVAIRDIVSFISTKLRKPDLVQFGALPTDPNDPPLIMGDVRRLTNEVGWRPTFTLEAGLTRAISWWRDNVELD